jgi:hypothetical protein
MAAFFFPEVVEPPSESDDGSGPEGSLTGSDAAEAPAVRTNKAGSKDTSSTADQLRGRTSTSGPVVAGNPRFMWNVSEDHSPPAPAAVPRPTPKSRRDPTNDKNFSVQDPSGPEGERTVPLRDHGAAPTSPPGGVLRALTSSELPWAVPDGPTRYTTPSATPHDRHRAASSARCRRPRAQLGPRAERWPRRSCMALYEAAPPAVGPTGTTGRARATGATRRRMHISAPPAAGPFGNCGARAGRRSCVTRSGPRRLRMHISAPPAAVCDRILWM